MKHLFTLKTIMLACLLFVGMGAWATTVTKSISDVVSENSYTVSSGSTIHTKVTSIDLDAHINVSIAVKDGATGNTGTFWGTSPNIDWRLYQGDEPTITVSAGDGYTISSVKFTYSNSNTGVINTSGHGQSIGSTYQVTSGKTYDVNAASATYYVGNTSTKSNGQARITAIEVVYTTAGGGTKYNVAIANNITNGTVTASPTSAAEGATVTLTATPASGYMLGSWNVTNASTSAAITVTNNQFTMPAANVNVSATFNKILFANLEELVAADLTSGANVTVSFENVPIKAFQTVSSTRKGVYFDIQKGGNDIEIYFNAEIPAEWVVGGTLSGTLTSCPWKLYSGTWELAPASGWAWSNLTYNAPALYAPSITTQPASATYGFNESARNLTVAASGNPAPTYQWYSNTTNSNENGTVLAGETNVSYKPSTATAGTFYYYCVATNSEGSATSSVATITVNEPVRASLPFSFDGGVSDIASKDGMSQTGIGSDYSSSPKLKFDSQGDNVIINFNEAAKKVTYTIKGNSTSGTYAFDVLESANGVDYTSVHHHTSVNDAASYTDNLLATSRFIKFVYTTKANGNIALGKISIIAASALDDPELAFEQSVYSFFTNEDMQVVATSVAGSAGAITYELTAGDEDAFMIDENTGEIACYTAGTYTVTANIAAATGFNSGTATCTVKILEPVVGNSIIVAEKPTGEYYAMTTTANSGNFGYQAVRKVGDKYVVDNIDNILFFTRTAGGQTTIQSTSNAQYVQATAAKNISYSENEYKWTNDGAKLTAADANHGTLQLNTTALRFTTYASKVGQYATIVDLANVIVGDVVTLNAACTDGEKVYGTYSNGSNWVVPEGLTVSEVCVVDGELAVYSYNEGDVVPANEGVMVCAENGGNYAVSFTDDLASLSPSLGANSLVGTGNSGITAAEMAQADTEFFRLTMHNGNTIGFFWGAAEGAAFDLGANKAYLAVATDNLGLGGDAKGGRLWVNNSTTGIKTVNAEATTNKAVKRIMNGQLIIEKAGKMFNAAGAEMK